jgi:hypothetical protein
MIINNHLLLSELTSHTGIRNALNLNRYTLRQLLNRNAASRRLMRKVLLVDFVHLGEVVHVVKEDIDLRSSVSVSRERRPRQEYLDNFVNARSGFLQDSDDVVDARLRLVANATLNWFLVLVIRDLS